MASHQNINRAIQHHTNSINSLWMEWVIAYGAITLIILCSFFVPKLWLPLVVLSVAWLLSMYVDRWRSRNILKCIRVTSVVIRSLVFTTLIMGLCLLYNRTHILEPVLPRDIVNPNIPYITSLIIFPVATVISLAEWIHFGQSRHCHLCKSRLGLTPQDRMSNNLFHTEAIFQLKLLFFISLGISAINWVYYFGWYSNASYNGQDKYFYLIVPIVIYILSLFYTGSRYRTFITRLPSIYNNISDHKDDYTEFRFLIIHDDTILLGQNTSPDDISYIDTPAIVHVNAGIAVTDADSRTKFAQISNLNDFSLRLLYTSDLITNPDRKIYHYIIVLNDGESAITDLKLNGVWSTLDQIYRLYKLGALSPALSAEIFRIYSITMAWKTYDTDGFRLYPIKNYVPTFRLRDFRNWDVDYSDNKWLKISSDNEDHRFYRLRRLIKQFLGYQSV